MAEDDVWVDLTELFEKVIQEVLFAEAGFDLFVLVHFPVPVVGKRHRCGLGKSGHDVVVFGHFLGTGEAEVAVDDHCEGGELVRLFHWNGFEGKGEKRELRFVHFVAVWVHLDGFIVVAVEFYGAPADGAAGDWRIRTIGDR